MTRATPTAQRNAVSAGMALGLALCGEYTVPFEKWKVDLAFEGAWRGWTHRTAFPQVNTDIRNGLDGTWAMVRADERKQTWPLFWNTTDGKLAIYTRVEDWDPEDPEDLELALQWLAGDVPADGWTGLARAFLDRFHRNDE